MKSAPSMRNRDSRVSPQPISSVASLERCHLVGQQNQNPIKCRRKFNSAPDPTGIKFMDLNSEPLARAQILKVGNHFSQPLIQGNNRIPAGNFSLHWREGCTSNFLSRDNFCSG